MLQGDIEAGQTEKRGSRYKLKSEDDREPKHTSDYEHEKNSTAPYAEEPLNTNPWEKCVEIARKYDDEMCEMLKDELDNLLIFAALFSAIVAAFTIDSYKWLRPNDNNPSPVSEQVAIQVNVLFFLSLAASLGVASTGILCMQWVRQYRVWKAKPVSKTLAARRQRFEGFRSWLVPEIISFLPVLMQAALVLFGIGLIRLLWALHHAVANAFMVISVITTAFVLLTMFAPVLQWWLMHAKSFPHWMKQCPYQSPQARFCYLLSWVFAFLYAVLRGKWWEGPGDWQRFDDSWMNLAVKISKTNDSEPSYEENLIRDELIWLDQESGHDIAGIQARAEALSQIHIHSAEKILSSVGPFKLPKKFSCIDSSKTKTLGSVTLPDANDKNDVFRDALRQQYLQFNQPEFSKTVKCGLLKVWYLWAHGRKHPSLDDAYMDARIQFMSDLAQDKIILPGLPRADHLNVHLLVQDGKNNYRIPHFLECLITIVSKGNYTSNNSKEIWSNIGDLLEYSIRHDYTNYFPTLSKLFQAFTPSMLSTRDSGVVKPVGPATPGDIEIAKHMLDGLNFLFSLHADQRLNPLSEDDTKEMIGLSALVLSLDNAGRSLDGENWNGLKTVLAAWMPDSPMSDQLNGDTPSERTSVALRRD